MGILTTDMKRIVEEQRLGYVATVCPDGKPNLSPKGTLAVWDDDHIVFADLRSPGTVENLRHQPILEINVVDPIARKGYRFKGEATVATDGTLFDAGCEFYRRRGLTNPIRGIVLVTVQRASALLSPAYDLDMTEDRVRADWQRYYDGINLSLIHI